MCDRTTTEVRKLTRVQIFDTVSVWVCLALSLLLANKKQTCCGTCFVVFCCCDVDIDMIMCGGENAEESRVCLFFCLLFVTLYLQE